MRASLDSHPALSRTESPRVDLWMLRPALILLTSLAAGLLPALPARGADTFQPGQICPDNNGVHINAHGGGILFHDGAYYWFGEHKIEGRRGNSAQVGVHCYSSTNLYDWIDRGIALSISTNSNDDIERGCVIERPKVVFNARTGRFVMWFHLELRGQGYRAARTAVAVSESITGPYRYLRSLRPNAGHWPENLPEEFRKPLTDQQLETEPSGSALVNGYYTRRDFEGGQMARDMTVFVDDDGKAYHIHAAEENYTLNIAALTGDYLEFTGRYVRVFPGGHNEAPAICKRNGKYWMITSGCTGWEPNAARSAVADSIWGSWTELGNPCEGVNPENGLGPEKTFGGQSTFILPVPGKPDAFIAMFDMWRPRNPIDGRYLWLPLEFKHGRIVVQFREEWDLSEFE